MKQFSCGRSQLDEFLYEDARNFDKHGLTNTVVVFHADISGPIGYFSLTADSVHLSSGERTDAITEYNMHKDASVGGPIGNEGLDPHCI